MPIFQYTASDRSGSLTKGELEAKDKNAASRELASQGMFVLEIKKQAGSVSTKPAAKATTAPAVSPSTTTSSRKPPRRSSPPPPKSVKPTKNLTSAVAPTKTGAPSPGSILKRRRVRWPALQQALYLRQLNVLFDAGVPIHQAASVLANSEEHPPKVKEILLEIPRDLERGRLLSKSLQRSGLFGKLVVSSVRLGEESGRLDNILESLAETKEASVKLRRTLVSRLTYPVIVLIIMSLGLVVMGHVMSRVMSSLPNFKPEDLPLFGVVSRIFQHGAFLPGCLLLFAAFAALCYKVYQTPSWRMVAEKQFMSVPAAGMLLRRYEANTITSQLSLLISAGLPIDRGMELCSELVATEVFRQALLQSKDDLRNGAELGDCFKISGLFPDDVLALVTAGEISGQLEESLARASEYCSDQVERTLETLLALLEPLLIGFLGIAIGTVLLCTFVPIFNSIQTM